MMYCSNLKWVANATYKAIILSIYYYGTRRDQWQTSTVLGKDHKKKNFEKRVQHYLDEVG